MTTNTTPWGITPAHPGDHELLTSPAGTPAAGTKLTNHGGPTIQNPRLVLVALGQWWGDTAKLQAFASDFMERGGLSELTAYGTGAGTYAGLVQRPALSGTTWADADLQTALKSAIADKAVPTPDGHTLYALLIPAGVTVTQGGQSSCSAFCGYHGYIDASTFYSVESGTQCGGCNGGLDAFSAFTMVLSHEISEACTDPMLNAWYSDADGSECGDLCAWQQVSFGPWTIQPEFTNEHGCTTPQYQSAPPPSLAVSTTTLAVSPNPVVAGSAVQCVASVTASGQAPTGTVSFAIASGPPQQSTLTSAGTASFAFTPTSAGTESIGAHYSGDASCQPSAAAPVPLTVQAVPPPADPDAVYWAWVLALGQWAQTASKSDRDAQAPTLIRVTEAFYPTALTPGVALVSTPFAPPPSITIALNGEDIAQGRLSHLLDVLKHRIEGGAQ